MAALKPVHDPSSTKYPDRTFYMGAWRTPEAVERRRQTHRDFMQRHLGTLQGRAVQDRRNAVKRGMRKSDPEYFRARQLRWRYGLSLEQYDEMLAAQNGVCAVCKRVGHTKHHLYVDHDHQTGQIRGLLCAFCNSSLGMLEEDPERIRELAAYIERWSP